MVFKTVGGKENRECERERVRERERETEILTV